MRAGDKIYNGHKKEGCPRCGGSSPMTQTFYKGNGGIKKFCCTDCEPNILDQKKRAVERTAKWRESKSDIKTYRNEEARKRREKYPEKTKEYVRVWCRENHEKSREYQNKYRKDHPEINRVSAYNRRVSVKEGTVPWSEVEAIKEFYRNRPENMVVDHIIPLKGYNVSGLHVISNLQYLTFDENAKKYRTVPQSVIGDGAETTKPWKGLGERFWQPQRISKVDNT